MLYPQSDALFVALDRKVRRQEARMRKASQRDIARSKRAALAPSPTLSRASRITKFVAVVLVAAWLALVLGYCAVQIVAPAATVAPSQIGAVGAAPASAPGAPYTLWAWDGAGWRSLAVYDALTTCREDALTVAALPPAGMMALDIWHGDYGRAQCAPDGHVPNPLENHTVGRSVQSWTRLESDI